ncbi:MAG TPA: hypothetical protein VE954_35060 [Oligoflexus sp.]|uniref:hypothetical protein n=1 Tax=Oligoflexus sp. TaxID=1971216 RepID=UPI002D5E186B|nr:hypothetical protein [Oligoflexus sp.]HYX38352.1 hypothetical protein [Oligoflexus sp.]
MEARTSKLEALQNALGKYFERFPEVNVMDLAVQSDVPYATHRRIVQSEVNEVKDETIVKLIERIMPAAEQLDFIRSHFPLILSIVERLSQAKPMNGDFSTLLRKFKRLNPHNLIIQLALSARGLHRDVVRRLTGELGLRSLDEMIEAGLLQAHENGASLKVQPYSPDLADLMHQVNQDVMHFSRDMDPKFALIGHVSESVTAEELARIVSMGSKVLREVDMLKEESPGRVPFFFDIVIGTYDEQSVFVRR